MIIRPVSDGVLRVLVVGQTPPPYHGQAVMVKQLLESKLDHVELTHVRLAFSKEIRDVGRVSPEKAFHLLAVIARIVRIRFRAGPTVLYYPPAGADRIPMYRDFVLLIATRWLFRDTVFHFHANGLCDIYGQLAPIPRLLFRTAYYKPTLAIRTGSFGTNDAEHIQAYRQVIIHNAVPDEPPIASTTPKPKPPIILCAAALRESKGIQILVEASIELFERGIHFSLELMGQFESIEFENRIRKMVGEAGLADCVHYLGVLTGSAHADAFRRASVFCMPTHYEVEGSPLVLIEAMKFSLPVVSTRWRGIPSMVVEGETGFLLPVRDSSGVAHCLAKLIADPTLMVRMGARGRRVYEEQYTAQAFKQGMQSAFDVMRAVPG